MTLKYVDLREITNNGKGRRVVTMNSLGEMQQHGLGWQHLSAFETHCVEEFLGTHAERYYNAFPKDIYQSNIHVWPASMAQEMFSSGNIWAYVVSRAGHLTSGPSTRIGDHSGGLTTDGKEYVWIPQRVMAVAEREWIMDRVLAMSGEGDIPFTMQNVFALADAYRTFIEKDLSSERPSPVFQELQQFLADVARWRALAGDTPLKNDYRDARRLK